METSRSLNLHPKIHLVGKIEIDPTYITLPTAPILRKIVATLAMNAGLFVSGGLLVEEVWGVKQSAAAHDSLQTHLYHLRRRGFPIVTSTGAYRMDVAPDEIDALQFMRHGSLALKTEGDKDARQLAEEALSLLHDGEFLPGLTLGPHLTNWGLRLTSCIQMVSVRLADASLRLGSYDGVMDQLLKAWLLRPAHERLAARLMIALYLLDQRAEALGVFQKLSRVLRTNHNLAPSTGLTYLHQRMLAGEELDLTKLL